MIIIILFICFLTVDMVVLLNFTIIIIIIMIMITVFYIILDFVHVKMQIVPTTTTSPDEHLVYFNDPLL